MYLMRWDNDAKSEAMRIRHYASKDGCQPAKGASVGKTRVGVCGLWFAGD
ncbi:hypothetical protein J27TS7_46170 [Paenibacillus dendritiformis]|nr:hypothetical protein J27TS7_46170 [Paenibacillus dendritiformis]